jgi:phosphopantothenoylcysteine decarboxylase/phosphopantothenate--cysteine ligase
VALLRERGVIVLEPASGRLATHGEWGAGRLPEPAELLAAVNAVLGGGRWSGTRTLVTAGGTREPIDAVRYIGNRSSGRMGFALADAAAGRGSEVVVVAANVGLPRAPGIRYADVGSAQELAAACEREFAAADVLVMCAAVADFRPVAAVEGKIAKHGSGRLALELEATTDVLATLSRRRRDGQTLVGFAAEHGSGALERARAKLQRKGLDAIVLNDVAQEGIGFDSPDNAVTIITAGGEQRVGPSDKRTVAEAVLDTVEQLRA